MIQIPEKTIPAFHSQTILSLNTQKVRTAKSSQTILQLNQNLHSHSPAPTTPSYRHPTLKNIVQKGQKISMKVLNIFGFVILAKTIIPPNWHIRQ